MKTIKKVSVSPLPRNEASVIDSLNSGDDPTVNAPSIRAVNAGLSEKANNSNVYTKEQSDTKYKLQGDFAIISNSVTGDGTANYVSDIINYPTGFAKSNCVVVSVMINKNDDTNERWSSGATFDSASYQVGGLPAVVYMKTDDLTIRIKNIIITDQIVPAVNNISATFNYKIVLMKVS